MLIWGTQGPVSRDLLTVRRHTISELALSGSLPGNLEPHHQTEKLSLWSWELASLLSLLVSAVVGFWENLLWRVGDREE